MESLHELGLFIAIVEEGSQTAAARRFGTSLQSVNRALSKLEREVGVELIRRTTRRSEATEAGMAFYRKVKPAVEEIVEARTEAMDRSAEPQGLLRISAPSTFASAFVVPAIVEYQREFPGVRVALHASDAPVDVIAGGFDISIRVRVLPDSTLTARQLGQIRLVTYAAATYFQGHDRPQTPGDLQSHDCILREGMEETWTFGDEGKPVPVTVRGKLAIDDVQARRVAVVNGLGVAQGPSWHVRDLIDSGALEVVLRDFEPAPMSIYAVFPPSRLRPAKTRLFVQKLSDRLKGAALY